MNYIDIILSVILLWGAYRGFSRGMIIEFASLLALGLGVYGGILFSDRAAVFLSEWMNTGEEYMPVIAFAVVFIVIVIAVFSLAKALEQVINLLALKLVNKLLGMLFGVLKMAFILSVVLLLVNAFDKKLNFMDDELKENSLLFKPIRHFAPAIIPVIYDADWKAFMDEDYPD